MAWNRTNLYSVPMRAVAGSQITWTGYPYNDADYVATVAMPGPVASSVWAVRADTGEWICLVWHGRRARWQANHEHTDAAKDQRRAVVEYMARKHMARRPYSHVTFSELVARFAAELYPTSAEPVDEPAAEVVETEPVTAEQEAQADQGALAVVGTAYLNAGPHLSCDVTVLRTWTRLGQQYAEVVTAGRGVSDWARPGRQFMVSMSKLTNFVYAEPALPVPAAVDPVATEPGHDTVDNTEPAEPASPELAAVRAEIVRVEAAILANANAYHGTSSMRGKQHEVRARAGVRRAAEYHRALNRLQTQERALVANGGRRSVKPGPVDPTEIAGAEYVATRLGWFKVVRVNRTTVTVDTGYSWTDRIPFRKIIRVRRHAEAAA